MNFRSIEQIVETSEIAGKDVKRIKLFISALAEREAQILAENTVKDLAEFHSESIALIAQWFERALKVAKRPWAYIFRDPFKGLRDATRKFAQRWQLNTEFIEAMG